MGRLRNQDKLSEDKMERTKKSKKQIDHNKNVEILTVEGKKVAITTLGVKSAIGKLLMTSTKVVLVENGRDVTIKKL